MKESVENRRILLKKYYDHTCTEEERQIVTNWLSNIADDIVLQDLLQEEWEETPLDVEINANTNVQWDKWLKKSSLETSTTLLPENNVKGKSRSLIPPSWFKIAAILILPLLATYTFFLFNNQQTNSKPNISLNELVVKETLKGQKLTLTLPDGSVVHLNSSSSLSFSKSFMQGNTRTVKLEGEAFFEVARMEKIPFIVETEDFQTTVLGTAFGVNSYPYNNAQFVAVIEGKVKVTSDKKLSGDNEVILTKNQMTSIKTSHKSLQKIEGFEKDLLLGWKEGLLVFKEKSLNEMIEILEEWYGVEFEIEGQVSLNKKFTGNFKNKPLTKVLDGLGFSSKFDYEIKDNKVYVKPKL